MDPEEDEHGWWWPGPGTVGRHVAERPPDPRRVDPVRAGQLRDLFVSGWVGEGADLAILRLVFAARSHGRSMAVPTWLVSQDTDVGRRPIGPPRHYVSTALVGVPPYTRSLDAAVTLQAGALPHLGYEIVRKVDARTEARLLFDDGAGPWHGARSAALALLAAIFDTLSRCPEQAAPYRSP